MTEGGGRKREIWNYEIFYQSLNQFKIFIFVLWFHVTLAVSKYVVDCENELLFQKWIYENKRTQRKIYSLFDNILRGTSLRKRIPYAGAYISFEWTMICAIDWQWKLVSKIFELSFTLENYSRNFIQMSIMKLAQYTWSLEISSASFERVSSYVF